MDLQNALEGVARVGGQGAFASELLTLFQIDTLGSLILLWIGSLVFDGS